jgi:hypothetical protein
VIQLPGVLGAAEEVQGLCERASFRFCFIGGVAVQRWGEPRLTQGVDLTVLTGFGQEEQYVDSLLATLSPRREDAREFALRHRVLLLRTASGVDVDVALGAFPFEVRSVDRASPWSWAAGHSLTTCCAEDLVVHKVFAGRDRDWADVEGILIRQYGKLDLKLARSELQPLLELKEQGEAMSKLGALIDTVARRLENPVGEV